MKLRTCWTWCLRTLSMLSVNTKDFNTRNMSETILLLKASDWMLHNWVTKSSSWCSWILSLRLRIGAVSSVLNSANVSSKDCMIPWNNCWVKVVFFVISVIKLCLLLKIKFCVQRNRLSILSWLNLFKSTPSPGDCSSILQTDAILDTHLYKKEIMTIPWVKIMLKREWVPWCHVKSVEKESYWIPTQPAQLCEEKFLLAAFFSSNNCSFHE